MFGGDLPLDTLQWNSAESATMSRSRNEMYRNAGHLFGPNRLIKNFHERRRNNERDPLKSR
jgi:hypothetical protein